MLLLTARIGDQMSLAGSGVLVRPGLALTALHVVDNLVKAQMGKRLERGCDHNFDLDQVG